MKIRDVVSKVQGAYDWLLDWADANPVYVREIAAFVVGFLVAMWVF